MNRLNEIRWELKEKAEAEATKLWRLARRAEKHGVSALTAYPERMLEWKFEYEMKYAFKF